MEREKLYEILKNQQKDFLIKEEYVDRDIIKEILSLLKLKMPIIISGIRRCGKSYLMKIIQKNLSLKDKEWLYVDFSDERFVDFTVEDFQKIIDYTFEEKYLPDTFLFLDEIQEIPIWEKWINRIKEKFRIIITGSNSRLNSSEMSTILTGRTISINLLPFSFKEFLIAKKIDVTEWKYNLEKYSKIRIQFKKYLVTGGMPMKVLTDNEIIIKELYEDILYKDILRKLGNSKEKEIREIGNFLISNPATTISSRNLMKITNIKNFTTFNNILSAYKNSYLLFYISKFDNSLKKQIRNPKKIYCTDNGFISTLGFKMSEENGRLLENLIYIELLRRRKEIYYYTQKNECDFVIRDKTRIIGAIQASYEINKLNREREINGLLEAMDKFRLKKGLILTYDQEEELKVGNKIIIIKPIWKWLLEGER